MRPPALWRHEVFRAGWPALAAPPLALLAPLAFAGLAGANHRRLLLAGPEIVFPLAVAFAAVAIVARDPAAELQLTLPTRFRVTLVRRLVALLGVASLAAVAYCAAVIAFGSWSGPQRWALAQSLLVWAGPTLALSALAVGLGGLTRSMTLTTTAVGGLWLVEQLFVTAFAAPAPWLFLFPTVYLGVGPGWAANRAGLLGLAVFGAFGAAWTLGRPERLLSEEDR